MSDPGAGAAVVEARAARSAGDRGVAAAERHVAIAEGSDWFWWYGDDHESAHIEVFDQLFRAHLTAAYEALDLPAPADLRAAIKGRFGKMRADEQVPVRFIRPTIDGRVTHFYEWKLAGIVEAAHGGGAMHAAENALRSLHYGFDLTHLFVRVDLDDDACAQKALAPGSLVLEIIQPRPVRIEVDLGSGRGSRAQGPVPALRRRPLRARPLGCTLRRRSGGRDRGAFRRARGGGRGHGRDVGAGRQRRTHDRGTPRAFSHRVSRAAERLRVHHVVGLLTIEGARACAAGAVPLPF